ncbi:hypothetical protein F4802DRAFT_507666 [Xylaria palmicola]|nr:hypothetical protein F4802DRAFT_507666 [Xylaria palmicola]
MQREATLAHGENDLMEQIRTKILKALPSPHLSRKAPSREHVATFKLDWDPVSFLKEQGYSQPSWKAFERAITLTGSMDGAQALTTVDYVSQVWPTTGKHTIELLTDAIRNTTGYSASLDLQDGGRLTARIESGKTVVTVTCITPIIVEVGQQLVWLGAALRSSPFETGVAICSSSIDVTAQDGGSGRQTAAGIFCAISFETQLPPTTPNKPQGQCWHNMFRNPVIVQGYPILLKREAGLGLEMPLDMMATLIGSNQLTDFDGRVFIKGFSTMLVAMKVVGDLLVWHYFYNSRQGYQSYLFDRGDATVDIGAREIGLVQLDTTRHVVGWCLDSKWNAGAPDAAYDQISRSKLPRPHDGCFLEKVNISGGKFVTIGATIALGVKDIPIHVTLNNYVSKLRWLHDQYVILWDEADKRGWLVNGTSALLHLVRTSLQRSSMDDALSSILLFSPGTMVYPGEKNRPNTAMKVLLDKTNRQLEIWAGKFVHTTEVTSTHGNTSEVTKKTMQATLFEDIVEERFSFLERMIAYQQHGGQNGINLKLRVRQHLEGWDFMDAATGSTLSGCVAALDRVAYGWVEFARSINAVTLFGKGFGDIIEPIKVCPLWHTVPRDKYYLAASVSDLNIIQEREQVRPPAIVSELEWLSPSPPFAPCPGLCSPQNGHDLVQVLRPRTSVTRLPRPFQKKYPGPGKLKHSGAIIFGDDPKWDLPFKNQPQKDLADESPDSMRVSANPRYFSPSTSSDSQNQETELSALGRSSQGQGNETEDTSVSAATPNLAPSAPVDSTGKSAQNIAPGNISADKAENPAHNTTSVETAYSLSIRNPARPMTPDRRMKTRLKRFKRKFTQIKRFYQRSPVALATGAQVAKV